ncbi:MAG TPA: hypothetical protein VI282_06490 [Verrucomicrobiae bacterium]|jgi:hypothetical protein
MASILSLLQTSEPAHLTMKTRPGVRSLDDLNRELDELLAAPELDGRYCMLARATILLWHDHFEAAHKIAQDVENPDGSLLHGIIHRREPDFSNARYWFHRVGKTHPSFACVAGKLKIALIGMRADQLAKRLLPDDKWHPLAFVDLLEDAQGRAEPAFDKLLREFQAAEFYCFLATLPSRVDAIWPKRVFAPPSS